MKCPECKKECELIEDDGHGYGDWYKCNQHGFVSFSYLDTFSNWVNRDNV